MRWAKTNASDPIACALSDRHYPRRKKGAKQCAPPGRKLVLRTVDGRAFWVTHWPYPEYVKHAYGDVWLCARFRNEAPELYLSSELIVEAHAATRALFGAPPAGGFLTFIEVAKVRPKRDPGRCFLRAGYEVVGVTAGGHGRPSLLVLRCPVERLPAPERALDLQLRLEAA